MGTSLQQLKDDAPGFATEVQARYEANTHHILGTIRPNGAPRLSGTEVTFNDGQVGLGMMPDSFKLSDVQRDPRVEIHSAPLDKDLVASDAKLIGRLRPNNELDIAPGSAFILDIEIVSLVQVDGDELFFRVWRPESGLTEIRRR